MEEFTGVVTEIGDWRKGTKADFRYILMADDEGEDVRFNLFKNHKEQNKMCEESYAADMPMILKYEVVSGNGDKTYTNMKSLEWADDVEMVVPRPQKEDKPKPTQQAQQFDRGEPQINREKQESIQTQVALKEVGEMMRCGMLQADAIDPMLVQAYWAWLKQHLCGAVLPRAKSMVESAEEILGAEVVSKSKPKAITKAQKDEIKALLGEQIDCPPEDVDWNNSVTMEFEEGHKVTYDEAQAWIVSLSGE